MNHISNLRPLPSGLRGLLKDCPDLPYRTLGLASPEVLADWVQSGMTNHRVFIDPEGRGAAAWCHLPWDSSIFGIRMARLDLLWAEGEDRELLEPLLDQILKDAQSEGVQHMAHRPE